MDLLKKLPADAKLKDIGAEIEVLAAMREGESQANRGEVVPTNNSKGNLRRGFQNSLDASFP
jgi:predicted transcriptional regulator